MSERLGPTSLISCTAGKDPLAHFDKPFADSSKTTLAGSGR